MLKIAFPETRIFDKIKLDLDSGKMIGCSNDQFLRFLKGVYGNKERLMSRMVKPQLKTMFDAIDFVKNHDELNNRDMTPDYKAFEKYMLEFIVPFFDEAIPFTYKEAFEIDVEEQREFQALVFANIDIPQMVHELGAKKLKTEGKLLKQKIYDKEGNFLGIEENNNIYEVHEVSGEKLGLNDSIYAIKCWCTTTNKEHWLWIEDKYKNDPLEAIASTFRVHANIIPYIKEIKRQGDILIPELTDAGANIEPEGDLVPLTAEQYFGLLTAQS